MRARLVAPFPYFGGKRKVANEIWRRFGSVKQYIEPFCGSAAVLLAAPKPASLEVIGDQNLYVANFWRCVANQPTELATWADYPVIHVDLHARHRWLVDRDRVALLLEQLSDPEWPGDPQVAGWWAWGQCCWIGSGWCNGNVSSTSIVKSQIPRVSRPGQGLTSKNTHGYAGIDSWIHSLAARLKRVRVINGSWDRTLNRYCGGDANTAYFFDPPYKGFESLYDAKTSVASSVEEWARANAHVKIALCGHVGDYDLPGWSIFKWTRSGTTYGSTKTADMEAIWFSPACNNDDEPDAITDVGRLGEGGT